MGVAGTHGREVPARVLNVALRELTCQVYFSRAVGARLISAR